MPKQSIAPADSILFYRAIPAKLRFSETQKAELQEFAATLREQLTGNETFTCLITDDRELQRLNKMFLEHDHPTDVLSFPSADGTEQIGEMAISIERAAAQAEAFGHSITDEIRILMLHGLLHLTGFDHESDSGEMALAERKWRTRFKLPNSLLGRNLSKAR